MRNISEMKIIQIDVTNACNLTCSNCTRFCGHYTKDKYFFMDLDYYEKAVISLTDYPGMVGMIGGEPTLHPKFLEMCEIIKKHIPDKHRRGLWTNTLTKQWKENESYLEEIYGYFNKGGHFTNDIQHTPILTAMEDFVELTDDVKEKYIDNCWVQLHWSATINPKGAFFCEVAGALSWLFNGPNGWDIEPGWWKKTIPEYEDQKNWACYKCGCSIPLKPRRSIEWTDDVSESNLNRLEAVNSPKIKKGVFEMFDTKRVDADQFRDAPNWYWGDIIKSGLLFNKNGTITVNK